MGVRTNTSSPSVSVKQMVANSSNTNKANKLIRKRRLTFAPEISKVVGTVISREDYTAEEMKRCWWSSKEVSKSRILSIRLIHTVRDRGQHFIRLIDDSFMVAQCLSTSLAEKEVDSLMKDPSKYTSKLEAWTLNGQGRRGLERNISVFQKRERTAGGREIRGMVVDTLRMGVSSEEAAEMYAEQSLASRIYARWMGQADYSSAYFV
jgi:predicted metalloprotease